jgi:hypothetical protein
MTRSYKRDSKGRFAGGSGGSGGTRKASSSLPKTTSARGRAKTRETAARAAVKAGGGTRAARSLATAQRARDWYKATGTGTKRSKTKPRSGIRPTGGLPRPQAANSIRRTTGARRGPMAVRMNAVRSYTPRTPKGQMDAGLRRMNKAVDAIKKQLPTLREVRKRSDSLLNRIARGTARDMADATGKGVKADVARLMLRQESSKTLRAGRDAIKRRAGRAAAAAARGSKPAAKAAAIYDRQLAPVLPKGKGKGKNNLRPGPGNTKGAPKKKRKPRKKG